MEIFIIETRFDLNKIELKTSGMRFQVPVVQMLVVMELICSCDGYRKILKKKNINVVYGENS